jgi:hypothetical protein
MGTPNAVITSSNLNGKRVENAPRYIQSWTFLGKNNISTTLQYRLTGKYLLMLIIPPRPLQMGNRNA